MKYEFIDHTADAEFIAYGNTLEEAFINSVKAMFSIITDTEQIRTKIKKRIKLKQKNQIRLIYEFLEELLFLLDTEGLIPSNDINLKINNNTLNAEIGFDNYKKYKVNGNIKSVTFNNLEIKKNNNKFQIRVVIDL